MTLQPPQPVSVSIHVGGTLFHIWNGLRVTFEASPGLRSSDAYMNISVYNPSLYVARSVLGRALKTMRVSVVAASQEIVTSMPLTAARLLPERGSWRLVMAGDLGTLPDILTIKESSITIYSALSEAARQLGLTAEILGIYGEVLPNFDFTGTLSELRALLGVGTIQFSSGRLVFGPRPLPLRLRARGTALGTPIELTEHIEQDFIVDEGITLYTDVTGFGQPSGVLHRGDSGRGVMITRCQFERGE